jgi:adenylate cyclase
VAADVRPEDVVLEDRAIRIGDRHLPLVRVPVPDAVDPSKHHDQHTMLINYRAPVQARGVRSYPTYEVRHLLQSEAQLLGGETPAVDPQIFKNKVVFVGLTASGLLDMFQTPFGRGVMPGIQLHASVADNVLSNQFLAPAPTWSAVTATLAGALVTGLMSAALPFAVAALGAVSLVAAWTGTSLLAFDRGLWLVMAQPILATAVALFAGTAYRYFVEDAEKRKVSRLFGRYVSRDVYSQLMAHPELAELGGGRREMTVLFSDLRGFTTITEKGNPEDLVAQLNEYFTRMVEVVFRNGGTVDKFVGDMVMALFGAPVDDVDHADDAVTTAVEMVRELGELNRRWASEGRVQLDIGIGVNSGDMIAGNIGSSAIMSYTVIGDNVNLGARLESLNKDYKTRIIISEATRGRLGKSYELRSLGGVVVKGKTRPVEIFEVIVPSPLVVSHGASDKQAVAAGEHEEKPV